MFPAIGSAGSLTVRMWTTRTTARRNPSPSGGVAAKGRIHRALVGRRRRPGRPDQPRPAAGARVDACPGSHERAERAVATDPARRLRDVYRPRGPGAAGVGGPALRRIRGRRVLRQRSVAAPRPRRTAGDHPRLDPAFAPRCLATERADPSPTSTRPSASTVHPTAMPPRLRLEEALLDECGVRSESDTVGLVLKAIQRRRTRPNASTWCWNHGRSRPGASSSAMC